MLISKFKTKSGKEYVSILVNPSQVENFKNKNKKEFSKIVVSLDYKIGLDKKKTITAGELFKKVPFNN